MIYSVGINVTLCIASYDRVYMSEKGSKIEHIYYLDCKYCKETFSLQFERKCYALAVLLKVENNYVTYTSRI